VTSQTKALANKKNGPKVSIGLDTWAVALALTLALLVGIGVLKHVPW
jgi:hypothetical protein